LRIRLPTGGALVAPTDPTQDLANACSRAFGLLPLVASYLASTQCLVKLLDLVGPLADLVNVLRRTPELAASAAKVLTAVQALAPCELAARTSGALPFVRDLLCVVLQAGNCILAQLKNLTAVMTGLANQREAAQAAGNLELVRALEAAQESAATRASSVLLSIEALQSVLDLGSVYLAIAGIAPVQLPPAPPNPDLNALIQLTEQLASSLASLQISVDALGGCGA